MADKAKVKIPQEKLKAMLEAKGVDWDELKPGATIEAEGLYAMQFKSGRMGFGGKVRTSGGHLFQITGATFIR